MPNDMALAADVDACRAILRVGSKSFSAAAMLLPRRARSPATVLYAFCRVADDAVDGAEQGGQGAVDDLRRRLDAAYGGTPDDTAIDRALSAVVARERLPRALLDALVEGMSWDASGRRYETLTDLYAYAARVAGSVGAMLALVMGARSPAMVARACDLGIAMQLTNVARDVGEDAPRGRIYLPLAWLDEAKIDATRWLANPAHSEALGSVVERLLGMADVLYARADVGIEGLPADCRPAIRAARWIYADIGRAIGRARFDSVNQRAVVGRWRKALLLLCAFVPAPRFGERPGGAEPAAPVLEPARFLVGACADRP